MSGPKKQFNLPRLSVYQGFTAINHDSLTIKNNHSISLTFRQLNYAKQVTRNVVNRKQVIELYRPNVGRDENDDRDRAKPSVSNGDIHVTRHVWSSEVPKS